MGMIHWPPRSLFGRVVLVFACGVAIAQFASLFIHLQDPDRPPIPSRFVWHFILTLVAVVAGAVVAARWITRPLQLMSSAATRFAHDLNAPPLDESGPLEVRQAARAFNFMQARLRQHMTDRSRALAAASHDLRTPLTRLRLRAELVADAGLREKLDADIDSMQLMVDGVLAYLRGQEDSEPVQTINMNALLESVVEDQRAVHAGRTISFTAGAPATCPGRLGLLKRAIANLVENATAYAETVHITIEQHPAQLKIVVEDDGPGIPEADLQRVTQPFVRLDTARTVGAAGVGMGLAIASDAAAAHAGELVLENRAGGGLRAALVLPR